MRTPIGDYVHDRFEYLKDGLVIPRTPASYEWFGTETQSFFGLASYADLQLCPDETYVGMNRRSRDVAGMWYLSSSYGLGKIAVPQEIREPLRLRRREELSVSILRFGQLDPGGAIAVDTELYIATNRIRFSGTDGRLVLSALRRSTEQRPDVCELVVPAVGDALADYYQPDFEPRSPLIVFASTLFKHAERMDGEVAQNS